MSRHWHWPGKSLVLEICLKILTLELGIGAMICITKNKLKRSVFKTGSLKLNYIFWHEFNFINEINKPSDEKLIAVTDTACGCIFNIISALLMSNTRTVPSLYPAAIRGINLASIFWWDMTGAESVLLTVVLTIPSGLTGEKSIHVQAWR